MAIKARIGIFATGILLGLPVFPAAPSSPKAPPAPRGQAERLRGEVRLARAKTSRLLAGESELRAGDVIRTGQDGRVRVAFGGAAVDLAPESVASLRRAGAGLALELLYGHARIEGERAFAVAAGPFRLRHAPGARALAYAHVARSARELHARLAGGIPEPASPKEARFSEVECAEGELAAAAPGRRVPMRLHAGDAVKAEGRDADFAPTAAGVDQIRANAEALGY